MRLSLARGACLPARRRNDLRGELPGLGARCSPKHVAVEKESAAMSMNSGIRVDPQQMLDDGYIVLRNVIPPGSLPELRASFEALVERQKAVWEEERRRDKLPGSVWETAPQPRQFFNNNGGRGDGGYGGVLSAREHAGRQQPADAGAGGRSARADADVQPGARITGRRAGTATPAPTPTRRWRGCNTT